MRRTLVALLTAAAIVSAGCSSDTTDSAKSASTTSAGATTQATTTTVVAVGPPKADAVGTATVTGPITTGKGEPILGPRPFDLSTVGYQQDEFFLSGTANSYTSATPLSEDGVWKVAPKGTAPYTTRVVVRRPADATKFNGTVFVEWLNVSGGLDASPDWTYIHTEMIREGAAWIGVSAQKIGIEGGGDSLGSKLALKNADPQRYGPLSHPGDDYSYDMFSQAGATAWFQSDKVLGGEKPKQVIALGESQSAFRLTSYVDAIAPLVKVFNGYLIHSRAGGGSNLSADMKAPKKTLIRSDQPEPVLVFLSETDLPTVGLGAAVSRQDDSGRYRAWEVAGTAHADSYLLGVGDPDDGSGAADVEFFNTMITPPDGIYGGVIKCDAPLNTGGQTYVVRAALRALDQWVRTRTAPPSMPRLQLAADSNSYELDANGNALGGIRTPQVNAPIAALSGLGQSGNGFCGLFGTTKPFDAAKIKAHYPDHTAFVSKWNAAVDSAVAAGGVLSADADHLKAAAAASTIGS